MKKLFCICILTVLSLSLFANDDSKMYWEKEIDRDGQLITYYLLKTDAQLSNNLEEFIRTITGIRLVSHMPNINTIRKQMVSEEYIEKKYPKLYKYLEGNNSDDSNKIEWDEYKYCFFGQPLTNESGLLLLARRLDDKIYFSIAVYTYGGLDWYYTNQSLDLFEASLE